MPRNRGYLVRGGGGSFGAAGPRPLPKAVVKPGEGAWIEAKQGRGITLVRNESFLSPSAPKLLQYELFIQC